MRWSRNRRGGKLVKSIAGHVARVLWQQFPLPIPLYSYPLPITRYPVTNSNSNANGNTERRRCKWQEMRDNDP